MKKSDLKNKVYVGNLPFSLDEEDLLEIFSEYGEISGAKIERENELGRSKGFGFLEFVTGGEAKKAIDEMNGEEFQGRKLTLKVFEEKKS